MMTRVCFCIVLALSAAVVRSEDARARTERFDDLIESLNATSERRARILEQIYSELRGTHARHMQETLREALSRENTLILQGAVQAMAMLGDPADVSHLEALLATNRRLEVKCLVLRLLPAFTLVHSERARFNYIRYAVGYERMPAPEVLEPLRRPPLTRRGRLDVPREQMRERVGRALVGQFDPVAAALRYVDDRLYGAAARRAVIHYVDNALGGDPSRWLSVWEAQSGGIEPLEPAEIEEIRLAALQSLADMGAEGRPGLIAAFRKLTADKNAILEQSCHDTLAVLCRVGYDTGMSLLNTEFAPADADAGEIWRRRRLEATAGLAVFAAETAGAALLRPRGDGGFESAALCLGAALASPPGFPDTDAALSDARARGLALLERTAMQPDITGPERAAATRALGEIGAERAVSAIGGIVESPYCFAESGDSGRLLAEAAVDALATAATGGHDGRDRARELLLSLLADERLFPPVRAGTPPVGLAHMVLWRLQRLARSNDTSLDPGAWRERLGW